MINRYRINHSTVYEYENNSYVCIGSTLSFSKQELIKMRNAKCDENNEIHWEERE